MCGCYISYIDVRVSRIFVFYTEGSFVFIRFRRNRTRGLFHISLLFSSRIVSTFLISMKLPAGLTPEMTFFLEANSLFAFMMNVTCVIIRAFAVSLDEN